MDKADENFLKSFNCHGLNFGQSSDGINFATRCPFTGRNGKFVVNKDTGQWQSFTAGIGGNVYTFLKYFYEWCSNNTKASSLQNLASNRQLPVAAFVDEVAFNPLNGTYIIPMKNSEGNYINLSYCYPGKTLKRTTKLSVGLYGLEGVVSTNVPIYLCEGEWDMLGLKWLFKTQGYEAIVAAAPGASVFKESWVSYFRDKTVYVCYDNDKAGFDGQQKVANMLRPIAGSIQFLAWPDVFRDKYDVRDFIIQQAGAPEYSKKDLKDCLKRFQILFNPSTRYERDIPAPAGESRGEVKVPKLKEVEDVFNKWIKLESIDPLSIIFGTYFSNKLGMDSTWLFLVGPPGGVKSELLMTLSKSRHIETTSDLTAASLVSGTYSKKGSDASLIPRLNNRCMVIKDFTVVLEKNTYERDAIFSILRDAYDGYVEKIFGTGVKKSYHSRFGIIAGVTPNIYDYSTVSASLGERFLKYRLDRVLKMEDEVERMKRAVLNIKREVKMREELQEIVYRYLEKPIPKTCPIFSQEQTSIISSYAMITARMRAAVIKDKYTGEIKVAHFREVGTRLVKQLHQLGIGICIHLNKERFDAKVMDLLKEVAVSTCPEMEVGLIKKVYYETADKPDATISTAWIINEMGTSPATVSRLVNDLLIKKILKRTVGEPRIACRYRLNEEIEFLFNSSEFFPKKTKRKIIFRVKK